MLLNRVKVGGPRPLGVSAGQEQLKPIAPPSNNLTHSKYCEIKTDMCMMQWGEDSMRERTLLNCNTASCDSAVWLKK